LSHPPTHNVLSGQVIFHINNHVLNQYFYTCIIIFIHFHILSFLIFHMLIFRNGKSTFSWDGVSPCDSGYLRSHDLPASASPVLGLLTCTTMPSLEMTIL
jgi:hypothetical protein